MPSHSPAENASLMAFSQVSHGAEELAAIHAALASGHLHGDGPFAQRCEAWLEERLDVKRALLTHSCTGALEMAAILADVGPGDEVIMPSFTFVSTANAFVLRGAVPVFVDIRDDTLNLDERLLEGALTPKTKAIVPVHYGGVPADMDAIMGISDRADVWVIEDAAQAIDSSHNGRALGSIGHVGCLSFHGTKNVVAGEGGALLVNHPQFIERAEIIREKGTNRAAFLAGQVDKYTWQDVGSSYLMSELAAAFLFAQLSRLEEIQSGRMRAWQDYHRAFEGLADQGRLTRPTGTVARAHNAHVFTLRFESHALRERIRAGLRAVGIQASFHYVPLHSSPAGRRFGRVGSTMEVTDRVSDRLLRLPLHSALGTRDVERVVAEVTRLLG